MTECRCGIRHIANLSEELNLASKRGSDGTPLPLGRRLHRRVCIQVYPQHLPRVRHHDNPQPSAMLKAVMVPTILRT